MLVSQSKFAPDAIIKGFIALCSAEHFLESTTSQGNTHDRTP
jgi:hypothetical protein